MKKRWHVNIHLCALLCLYDTSRLLCALAGAAAVLGATLSPSIGGQSLAGAGYMGAKGLGPIMSARPPTATALQQITLPYRENGLGY